MPSRWPVVGLFLVLSAGCSELTAPRIRAPQADYVPLPASSLDIATSHEITCVLRNGSTVECHGADTPPTEVAAHTAASGSFTSVDVGAEHMCALRTDGQAECAGSNDYGEAQPLWSASSGSFTALALNGATSCGLRTAGDIECIGPASAVITPATGSFTQISLSISPGCGVRTDGHVQCWGAGGFGQAPAEQIPLSGNFVQVDIDERITCALRDDNKVECWGNILGAPGLHQATASEFVQVAVGDVHGCGLRADGVVECWGDNTYSQAPATRTAIGSSYVRITASSAHTCAIRSDELIECWGLNSSGEAVSEQKIIFASTPPDPAATGQTYVLIAASTITGQTLTFSSLTPSICTVSGDVVTLVASGTCTIEANAAGDAVTLAAPAVQQSFAIIGRPAAPANILAAAISPTRIDLSWTDQSADETGFTIQRRSLSSASPWVTLTTTAPEVVTYGDNTAAASELYQYRVKSCSTLCSNWINSNRVSTTPLPLALTALSGTRTSATALHLAWSDANTGESRVEIQRLTAPGTVWFALATLAAATTSYDDNSVQELEGFRYQVRACNVAGCTAWLASGVVSTGTLPLTPTSLSVGFVKSGVLSVTWQNGGGTPSEFQLQRATVEGGWAWVPLTTLPATTTIYADSSASDNGSRYRVRACHPALGCSAWATIQDPSAIPSAPVALAAPAAQTTYIDLTWSESGEISQQTRFELQRRARAADHHTWSAWQTIATPAPNATSYHDAQADTGVTYMYRIRSCNGTLCSAYGTTLTVMAGPAPALPTSLTSTAFSATQIDLAWIDASTSETYYQVQRRARTALVWSDWVTVGTPAINAAGFSDTGLSANAYYRYRVRACNPSACSAYVVSSVTVTPN